jgi:hypothetical protein
MGRSVNGWSDKLTPEPRISLNYNQILQKGRKKKPTRDLKSLVYIFRYLSADALLQTPNDGQDWRFSQGWL